MSDITPNTAVAPAREVLPKNLKPLHYDLCFTPHLEEAAEFEGTISIELGVIENTSTMTLNALDLKILETQVVTSDGGTIEISGLYFNKSTKRMSIILRKELLEGSKVVLKQSFKGSMLHHASGFHRCPIKSLDGRTRWMGATYMAPNAARTVFPCFDEPALKATFTVTLVADKSKTSLSNMNIASEANTISNGKEKRVVTFNKTPLMSTYILAFAVGDLQMIETDYFRVPVRVYAPIDIDMDIKQGKFAVELVPRTLKTFEKIFDIDFPLPKLDLIAVPGTHGAMENWGLITSDASCLLVDEKGTSAQALRSAASILVHEISHQWFGNLVTMDFWEGLWLNEGFADWAQLHAWETLEPGWDMWQEFITGGYRLGLQLDSNRASHPIEVPVNKTSEINQIFDEISYSKGCAVIRMISRVLGEDAFIHGVRWYLKKHAYGNINARGLWDALHHVTGRNVGEFMEVWTKTVGYPVVSVDENESEGTITITQHRFFQNGSFSFEEDKTLYPLLLGLRTKDGTEDKYTLHGRSSTIKTSLDSFKLNADQTGFFRVAYTPQRLKILGKSVKHGLLSAEDRIGIIPDAMAMASSGYMKSKTPTVLSLLEDFDEETSYFVWKQILKALRDIMQAWSFEDTSTYESLKFFKSRLLQKCRKKKGWDFKADDNTIELLFKADMFSASGDDPEVQKAATDMFNGFIAGKDNAININIQNAVFAIALRHVGTKVYDAILKALKSKGSMDKRDACLTALGCAKEPALISRTLDFAISPEMIAHCQTEKIISSLTTHRAGKEALWNWLKANLSIIHASVGDSLGTFARVVHLCTASLSTREHWQDVKSFFEHKDTKSFNVYLAQSLDTILAKAT